MSANYTQQKLWQAVQALIGPGHIQERLNSAAVLLVLLDPRMAFPSDPDAQTLFDRSIKRLTSSQPTGDEGTIEATTYEHCPTTMGRRLAEDIFRLFCRATELADTPVWFSNTIR